MTKHYNQSIAEDSARILNSKQGDYLPSEVGGPVAVIPIVRRANIVEGIASDGNIANVYTTPSSKDFYLSGATLSFSKDATATATYADMRLQVDGVSKRLMILTCTTLTVQNGSMNMVFPTPIKVDRGTAISIRGATATATMAINGTIIGYTVETTKLT